MRRSTWTPSIVPVDYDETVYLVADDFGRIGRAWGEADYEARTWRLSFRICLPASIAIHSVWSPSTLPSAGQETFPKMSLANYEYFANSYGRAFDELMRLQFATGQTRPSSVRRFSSCADTRSSSRSRVRS